MATCHSVTCVTFALGRTPRRATKVSIPLANAAPEIGRGETNSWVAASLPDSAKGWDSFDKTLALAGIAGMLRAISAHFSPKVDSLPVHLGFYAVSGQGVFGHLTHS